jgi:hypothetical protein
LSVSFGWQTILNQADKRAVKTQAEIVNALPTHHYERRGNLIIQVAGNGKPVISRKIPKHPLLG